MTKLKILKPFERTAQTIDFSHEEKVTKQSFRDECDINHMMKKYQQTGLIENVNNSTPRYLDVSELVDFREAQDIVIQAKNMFMEIPAEVRERFGNDPAQFLDFCSDETNRDELISLGLLEAPAVSPEASDVEEEVMPPQDPEGVESAAE